eukprot:10527106-Prorocentrum_lima.AAC.1
MPRSFCRPPRSKKVAFVLPTFSLTGLKPPLGITDIVGGVRSAVKHVQQCPPLDFSPLGSRSPWRAFSIVVFPTPSRPRTTIS